LLERGRTTKEIAEELHLSTETVRNHVRRLLRTMGAHSRLEAVAIAHEAA
jgi:DNA-binding NarL/FixJ family response regulator